MVHQFEATRWKLSRQQECRSRHEVRTYQAQHYPQYVLAADIGWLECRGIYCLLVVATMLDIITPELVRGLRAFVSRYHPSFLFLGHYTKTY